MKLDFKYLKFYPSRYWFLYFKKYQFFKGITIRIFGCDLMIKERNATEKLIAKFRMSAMA